MSKPTRKCYACERRVEVVRGRLAKHTTDHDGPGWPYDCPGGGLNTVENMERREARRKSAAVHRLGSPSTPPPASPAPTFAGVSSGPVVKLELTVQQLAVADLLRESGLWGYDMGDVLRGIFAGGLRDAYRWLQAAASQPAVPQVPVPSRSKDRSRHARSR